ncbi:uncharacterized protein LOC129593067 [Paramacrobiotus metropolitanus]|uniref:uncharacterized protein LOC129593067 n=1 Tax=Paramacrobiotus metropolitanus TaxID=2943436 RepID=UPI0024458345|nr:uncharacterized protein LOC129593067 [Paramacrobiotus metropolitanus]
MTTLRILLFSVLCAFSRRMAVASTAKKMAPRYSASAVPFPRFAPEPIMRRQCALQFTENCRPSYVEIVKSYLRDGFQNYILPEGVGTMDLYTKDNCTFTHGVQLHCSDQVTHREIQKLAVSLSQPPVRAVLVNLTDGPLVTFENLSPIREQTVILNLYDCVSARTTGKLVKLDMPNLLNFELHNCYDMVVKRADFWSSIKLRMILFANTTLRLLETDTFTDLPALRLLSLEKGFSEMEVFNKNVREYLHHLHCGGEHKWFRQWWSSNGLLHSANRKEIFNIPNNAWYNEELAASAVYLPIDCAAVIFPNGSGSIDFTQYAFSINDNTDLEEPLSGHRDVLDDDTFPVVSMEPPNDAERELCLLDVQCQSLIAVTPRRCPNPDTNSTTFNVSSCLRDFHRLTALLVRLPPRPLFMYWTDNIPIERADLERVRPYIFGLQITWGCSQRRTTSLPHRHRLVNLLEYGLSDCTDLEIKKADFHYSRKLRDIQLYNCTIRSLEINTFSDLPSLELLSLEGHFHTGPEIVDHSWFTPAYDQRIRSYLFRLHCSCEFAWYRRWRASNTALMSEADEGDVWWIMPYAYNGLYFPIDAFVPIDCAQPIPYEPDGVDANQTAYSLHEPIC